MQFKLANSQFKLYLSERRNQFIKSIERSRHREHTQHATHASLGSMVRTEREKLQGEYSEHLRDTLGMINGLCSVVLTPEGDLLK